MSQELFLGCPDLLISWMSRSSLLGCPDLLPDLLPPDLLPRFELDDGMYERIAWTFRSGFLGARWLEENSRRYFRRTNES